MFQKQSAVTQYRLLVVFAVVAATLAACGGDTGTTTTTGEAEAATSAPTDTEPAESTTTEADGVSLPTPEMTELQIGHAAFEVGSLATYIASSEGLFEKYGLDVELVQFEGDGPAAQALAAGQIDGAVMGGGPILSAMAAGTPMQMVFVTRSVPTDSLATPEEIQSGEDLRGEQIAISTFGGDSHTAVVTALDELGLTPDDVVIVQIGGQSDRFAALQAGAVSAAPIEGIPDEELAELGLHSLVNLAETDLRLARAGLVVPGEIINESPNTVLALVAALLEGQTMMVADSEFAVQKLAEGAGMPEEDARQRVEPSLRIIDPDGRGFEEMFELQQTALVTVNEAVADVDPADAFTNEFIDRLEEMGFFEEIGVPGS